MRILRAFIAIAATLALAGCAATYLVEGNKYQSRTEATSAAERMNQRVVAGIQPFSNAPVKRELVIMIPSENLIHENLLQIRRANSTPPAPDVTSWLAYATHLEWKTVALALQKKNTHQKSEIIEFNDINLEPQAASTRDYFYVKLSQRQFASSTYLASANSGKILVTFDRTAPNMEKKVESLLEQVLAAAMR